MKLAVVILASLVSFATPAGAVNVSDGGSTLPPCNSAWWGSTTQYQGHTYRCYYGASHLVIVG